MPKSYRHRSDVDEGVNLENEDEERPEVVKNLREEVPEDSDVRSQVRHGQQESIRRSEKIPRPIFDVSGSEEQQHQNEAETDGRLCHRNGSGGARWLQSIVDFVAIEQQCSWYNQHQWIHGLVCGKCYERARQ